MKIFSKFSGTIKMVEVKDLDTKFGPKRLTTICLTVPSVKANEENTQMIDTTQDFYLKYGGNVYKFAEGQEAHFITRLEYRRIESRKAYTTLPETGSVVPFTYPVGDHIVEKHFTKSELAKGHEDEAKKLRKESE